jgi:hypothetical protein
MSPQRPEQEIQRTVFQHFAIRGASDCFAFHVPNGGWRSQAEASILKACGVHPGVPDVIAIKGGAVFALELKAPRGRTSEAQLAAHSAMRAAGVIVATAIGLDAAIAQLELWGLLRGRASLRPASSERYLVPETLHEMTDRELLEDKHATAG